MADPVLIATAKATNANSYPTRAEAQAILDERLYISAWTAATGPDQDRALIMATRLLDEGIAWYGSKRTIEQSLRWPRGGMEDADGIFIDYDTIPALLKRATSEFALYLLVTDRLADPGALGQGVKRAKAGEVEVELDASALLPIIPDVVAGMLVPFGEVSGALGRGDEDYQARVVRV